MKRNSQSQTGEYFSGLDDHDLMRIVTFEYDEYEQEAITIAHAELSRRNLGVPTVEEYWARYPSERIDPSGFCQECMSQTTDESPGNLFSINLLGIRLLGPDYPCRACGSGVQRKWFCFVFPLIPLAKYRIIYGNQGYISSEFIGRKIVRGTSEDL